MISSIPETYYPCNVSVIKFFQSKKVIGGTAGWLTVSNIAGSTRGLRNENVLRECAGGIYRKRMSFLQKFVSNK